MILVSLFLLQWSQNVCKEKWKSPIKVTAGQSSSWRRENGEMWVRKPVYGKPLSARTKYRLFFFFLRRLSSGGSSRDVSSFASWECYHSSPEISKDVRLETRFEDNSDRFVWRSSCVWLLFRYSRPETGLCLCAVKRPERSFSILNFVFYSFSTTFVEKTHENPVERVKRDGAGVQWPPFDEDSVASRNIHHPSPDIPISIRFSSLRCLDEISHGLLVFNEKSIKDVDTKQCWHLQLPKNAFR